MGPLEKNEKIPMQSGQDCIVGDYISEGGIGYIYTIDKKTVLKWYKPGIDLLKIKSNIQQLSNSQSPYNNLAWPRAMTKDYQGSFGYLMPRIPKGYAPLSNYIYDDNYYLNLEEMLHIGYAIAASFDAIHQQGYVYQDINLNGIFINKLKQSVIICDLDNCNKEGIIFVSGTPMYMAPEIVIGMANPNLYTDYYSLSVVLFRLFYINHPLEGKKTWQHPLSQDDEVRYFGSHPLFVCDPIDHSNGFYGSSTAVVQTRWGKFPEVLQKAFTKAFTTGLKNPEQRLTDQQWKNIIRQTYGCYVRKNIEGRIREGFYPVNTNAFLKLCIHHDITLLCESKKIFGFIFDENEIFTTVIFSCIKDDEILIQCDDLYINHQLRKKGEKRLLTYHDVIEYHGVRAIVE